MNAGLPYFTSCADVLARVAEFIDRELAEADCARIQEHLDECGPCLREFGLDQLVKDLVKRSCGCEPLPTDLRARVMVRLQVAREQATVEVVAEESIRRTGPNG